MSCRRQAANPLIGTPDMTIGEMMIACFTSQVPAEHLGGGVSGCTENQMRLAASP